MEWQVIIMPPAERHLLAILDQRIRKRLLERIAALAEEPEKQGKALLGELTGIRSIRAVGQRYRIIYQIRGNDIVVVIVAVGIRRDGAKDDIYNLAKKLFRLGLLSE